MMGESNLQCVWAFKIYNVFGHLMENPKHIVNFDSPIILDRSNYSTKLRIKETLHIAKRQPQLNVDSQSLSLYLFNA